MIYVNIVFEVESFHRHSKSCTDYNKTVTKTHIDIKGGLPMKKQHRSKNTMLTQFVEHEDSYHCNAMQRYSHENLRLPINLFPDRRG